MEHLKGERCYIQFNVKNIYHSTKVAKEWLGIREEEACLCLLTSVWFKKQRIYR